MAQPLTKLQAVPRRQRHGFTDFAIAAPGWLFMESLALLRGRRHRVAESSIDRPFCKTVQAARTRRESLKQSNTESTLVPVLVPLLRDCCGNAWERSERVRDENVDAE
jgi:hypothetical protein